jgi:hypothetical protein
MSFFNGGVYGGDFCLDSLMVASGDNVKSFNAEGNAKFRTEKLVGDYSSAKLRRGMQTEKYGKCDVYGLIGLKH